MERKRRDYQAILERNVIPKPRPGESEIDAAKRPWDLDLLARQVMVRLLEDRNISEKAAAELAGIDQRTLNRLMLGKGTTLRTLAKICAGFETTPMRFIDSHPEVGRQRPAVRIARDQVYDRFRRLLAPHEQDELLSLIEQISNLNLYQAALASLRGIVEAAKITRQRTLREKRSESKAKHP